MKSDKKTGSYAVLALMLVLLVVAAVMATRLTDLSVAADVAIRVNSFLRLLRICPRS